MRQAEYCPLIKEDCLRGKCNFFPAKRQGLCIHYAAFVIASITASALTEAIKNASKEVKP